ncbi:hypothetical protein PC9H_001705 [Pleurotus ostreatus]|uniref:HAMP domain-containing protein n=1 Tax=Pleurotus ostreatus TaxID=5322 RepID=A0A8H7A3D6_PLEOS|nr:uncharacterized protein PC9H_001705 [Pleurotus ostreatus]KAF7441355.1 hypothetical protein PC9H_001705 [Pleurotus ostreatus]
MASDNAALDHPFLSYLAALLSVYELGPDARAPPPYDGPSDLQTDAIVGSLTSIVKRMYQAEASERNEVQEAPSHPPSSTSPGSVRHINISTALDVMSTPEGALATDKVPDIRSDASAGITPIAEREVAVNYASSTSVSALAAASIRYDLVACPTCGKAITDPLPASGQPSLCNLSALPSNSPLVSEAELESGLSAAEELELLKVQVVEVARVCNAVSSGDLSQRIAFPVHSIVIVEVKDAINKMMDKLDQFSKEVTRVTLDVGSQGELWSQIHVPDVEGVWYELARNLNQMCYSMTNQVRSIAEAIKAIAKGDLTHRIQIDARGEMLELKATVNGMTEILSGFAGEVARVTRSIGTEGRLGVQARTNNLGGTWRYLTDSVNIMAANLTLQVRTIASAMTAVTRGDLTQKITGLAVSGEMLELVNTINDMLVQLVVFAREIKKVTREFGIEGMRLCVQAEVGNAQGIWQEIIQSLNMMASNLTTQLRDFTQVSVMGGDSSMFVTVEAGGESDSLKTQIDQMIVLRTNSQENSSAPTAL